MRISRKKRPQKLLIPHYRRNQFIDVPEVRLLAADNSNLGLMPTEKARELAAEAELDLVEINPKAEPPVCKLIDFANFKYQKEKEARKQKASTHEIEIKGIRLSIRISDHDMGVRLKKSIDFLDRGDKVKVEVILRGRENAKPQMAFDVINRFADLLNEQVPIRTEQETTKQGNKVTAILAKK